MQNKDWTEEHVEQCQENLEQVKEVLNTLECIQKEHDKGGTYFNATKKLLEAYRGLRFDVVSEKMLKTVESATEFKRSEPDLTMVALDNILSMPDIYAYYCKELKNFISSNTPVTMGLFVHLIDSGIKTLDFFEKQNGEENLRFSEILKASYIDEEKTPQELFDMFHTNRSTFYRKKDDAITALSIVIFGPLGSRHPASIINDNAFAKKYKRFFEIADTLDIMCGCIDVTNDSNVVH